MNPATDRGVTIRAAIGAGCRHALGTPKLIVWLWLLTLVAAAPLALTVRSAVERSVGPSRVHEDLRRGFEMNWYSEYEHEAIGVERLLTPTSVGPAHLLDNLDDWWSGRIFSLPLPVLASGGIFVLVWTAVLGGILHRFVYRQRALSPGRFLSHVGEFAPRFVRLLLLTGLGYLAVYRSARWIFPRLEEAMIDVTVERIVLAVYLATAATVVALLVLVKLVSDYAKVATVLEGRRSMIVAAWHALRLVARHPRRTFGPYAGIALVAWTALAIWALLAPGQGQASLPSVVFAFLYAQLAVGARLVARLSAYGAAVEVYRGLAALDR